MKNLAAFSACLILFVCSGSISGQEINRKQSFGIQLNPYLDSHFFQGTFIRPVFALRYSRNLNEHISFGPEFSGIITKMISSQHDYYSRVLNLGGFARYTFFPENRIKPLIEVSPYYSFYHFKSGTVFTAEGVGKEINDSYFSGYISPGISISNKSKKISLDLLYKFSNKYFANGHKSVFTYRLNFSF